MLPRRPRDVVAGTLNGDPVRFLTTVHGPVVGYATSRGVPAWVMAIVIMLLLLMRARQRLAMA